MPTAEDAVIESSIEGSSFSDSFWSHRPIDVSTSWEAAHHDDSLDLPVPLLSRDGTWRGKIEEQSSELHETPGDSLQAESTVEDLDLQAAQASCSESLPSMDPLLQLSGQRGLTQKSTVKAGKQSVSIPQAQTSDETLLSSSGDKVAEGTEQARARQTDTVSRVAPESSLILQQLPDEEPAFEHRSVSSGPRPKKGGTKRVPSDRYALRYRTNLRSLSREPEDILHAQDALRRHKNPVRPSRPARQSRTAGNTAPTSEPGGSHLRMVGEKSGETAQAAILTISEPRTRYTLPAFPYGPSTNDSVDIAASLAPKLIRDFPHGFPFHRSFPLFYQRYYASTCISKTQADVLLSDRVRG